MTTESLLGVLGWCCVINYFFLLVWWLYFMVGGDWMYGLHNRWFAMSRERFNATHYSLMGTLKILVLVFNLAPYLALRIVG
jgi:hypothetical protein